MSHMGNIGTDFYFLFIINNNTCKLFAFGREPLSHSIFSADCFCFLRRTLLTRTHFLPAKNRMNLQLSRAQKQHPDNNFC